MASLGAKAIWAKMLSHGVGGRGEGATSTCMPPDLKSKQSKVTKLQIKV